MYQRSIVSAYYRIKNYHILGGLGLVLLRYALSEIFVKNTWFCKESQHKPSYNKCIRVV